LYIIRVSREGEYLFDLDFDRPQLIVGRSHDVDISLPHGTVSRRHACLYQREGRILVADMGSSNGTFVNGRPVQGEYALGRGDVVYCGIFTLEAFQKPASVSRQSEPAPTVAWSPTPQTTRPQAVPPPVMQRPVSSSTDTIAPGAGDATDLHAKVARRLALREAHEQAQAQAQPRPEPRAHGAAPVPTPAYDERRREWDGDREVRHAASPRPEQPRRDERPHLEPPPRQERRWDDHRGDPSRDAGPDDPTLRDAPRPMPPAPKPPPTAAPAAPRFAIPPPSFGELLGPSVMNVPSGDS
jgi:hypothetical protein